jgi:uncharacterized membrane protein YedE/YeeE
MDNLLIPVIGGAMIGVSSLAMLALLGRIAGISGIFAGVITAESGSAWRWAFMVGLIGGPLLFQWQSGSGAPLPSEANWPFIVAAGFLVGFGTRYAGGCTSGHGVCGIGRLSQRSIAATATFIGVGVVTVFITRHLLGL